MEIYVLFNKRRQGFVRYGVNGGGFESYCAFRGKPCFFRSREEAERVAATFDNPGDYEIRTFKEVAA